LDQHHSSQFLVDYVDNVSTWVVQPAAMKAAASPKRANPAAALAAGEVDEMSVPKEDALRMQVSKLEAKYDHFDEVLREPCPKASQPVVKERPKPTSSLIPGFRGLSDGVEEGEEDDEQMQRNMLGVALTTATAVVKFKGNTVRSQSRRNALSANSLHES
jgi:hypothetical protein